MQVNQTQMAQAMNQAGVQRAKWSFQSGHLGAPIATAQGQEFVRTLSQKLQEVYTNDKNPDYDVKVVIMDNQQDRSLAYSVLLIVCKIKGTDNAVSFHTLILEATGDKPPIKYETHGGQNVEIQRFAADAADRILFDKSVEVVKRAAGVPHVAPAGTCVVPRDFDMKDEQRVHALALNAGLACTNELEIMAGMGEINLAGLDTSGLQANVVFNKTQSLDAVGHPVRGDLTVSLVQQTQQPQTQGQVQSLNNGDRTFIVSEFRGFVDILYVSQGQSLTTNAWFNPNSQPNNTPKELYASRLVITDILSNYSFSPTMMLFAVATAHAVSVNNNWINAFRPQQTNDVDLHDIGALNIEAGLGGVNARVDTKSDSFGAIDLNSYIASIFRPGLAVSMDIPEQGPQSWYLNMFSAAAAGSQFAANAIVELASKLTNGTFSTLWQAGADIFVDRGNRIHMGYYTDKNGVKRDIRDIDYLAVANLLGEKDPSTIRDWSDTFTQTNFPLSFRLQARKRMIQSMTGHTAEFTGYAERVTFSSVFLKTLVNAIVMSAGQWPVHVPQGIGQQNNQRGVASFINQALLDPIQQTWAPARPQNPNLNQYHSSQWAGYNNNAWSGMYPT